MAKEAENLQETLKPFYQRASEAEDRLSKLEAALANKQNAGDDELRKTISELQSKLEDANGKLASEQEKISRLTTDYDTQIRRLTTENEKQKYRILHLIRARIDTVMSRRL